MMHGHLSRGPRLLLASLFTLTLAHAHGVVASPISVSAAGANSAAIQPTVLTFQTTLGTLNPNVVGSFASGRREINWDGVPDALSAPNLLPANFFNSNSPRGVVFSTAGTGFEVSSSPASGVPLNFGNINPAYTSIFAPFSIPRLFTALGSNVLDVNFFVPGSNTLALTNGFGAVFSHVDLANTTSLQFFNQAGNSLGTFFVPATTGNQTFSFLGVSFTEGTVVSRVQITNGNQILGPSNTADDLVVMDDFIYGEPQAIPEPSSLVMAGTAAMVGLGCALRRRQRIATTRRS
jgi:hypothetical protein